MKWCINAIKCSSTLRFLKTKETPALLPEKPLIKGARKRIDYFAVK